MTTFEALRNKGQELSQEITKFVNLLARHQQKHGRFSRKDSERALSYLRQKENDLYTLKKEINFHIKQIRLRYQEKSSNIQPGILATIAGKGKAIQDKANKKRQVIKELNQVLKPYEELILFIDKLLNQISGVKISLQEFTLDSVDTKPLKNSVLSREDDPALHASQHIYKNDPSKKISFRGSVYSVTEIVSIAEELIRQNPSNLEEILDLSQTLNQEITNIPPEVYLLGRGKYSLDEITLVTKTTIKLVNKYGELSQEEAKRNPQPTKWPTFQPLLREYSETTDSEARKRLSLQIMKEIKILISAREKSLKSPLASQAYEVIKAEIDELNRYLVLQRDFDKWDTDFHR